VLDPKINDPIVLPVADRTALIEGKTRAEYLKDPLARRALQGYVFQAGQPAEVRDEFLAAMGFNGAEINEMSSRPAPSRA
jgi:5,5'-dehydrodivanillate O-demethylase